MIVTRLHTCFKSSVFWPMFTANRWYFVITDDLFSKVRNGFDPALSFIKLTKLLLTFISSRYCDNDNADILSHLYVNSQVLPLSLPFSL